MKKSVGVLLTLVVSVTFLVSFMKPKESLYKNLKVLPKNISKADMDSVMHHFTGSLGVKCTFCHVKLNNEKKDWDFANDTLEEKQMARHMLKMTKSINKKFFKNDIKNIDYPQMNEVTCNSCHNGNKKPKRMPPPEERSGQRPPLPPPQPAPAN